MSFSVITQLAAMANEFLRRDQISNIQKMKKMDVEHNI